MKRPDPVLTVELFPELLESLLALLDELDDEEWNAPTACAGWDVKDVAAHLFGGDIGVLSRSRDGYSISSGAPVTSWNDLVALIDRLNAIWIDASRRISPRLLCDLLAFTGKQVYTYFHSLDPHATGQPVSWAGPEAAPVWLDIAREYTERWHHQQHIREAVGRPGLTEPRYLGPVLGTFVRALPHAYRTLDANDGTVVGVTFTGAAGSRWLLRREREQWQLYVGEPGELAAEVIIPQDLAWRLFTKGITPAEAQGRVTIRGNENLGTTALAAVSIIA